MQPALPLRGRRKGEQQRNVARSPLEVMTWARTSCRSRWPSTVNVWNAAQVFTENGWFLSYVSFTSIKKSKPTPNPILNLCSDLHSYPLGQSYVFSPRSQTR